MCCCGFDRGQMKQFIGLLCDSPIGRPFVVKREGWLYDDHIIDNSEWSEIEQVYR